jgi:hypothetical protein
MLPVRSPHYVKASDPIVATTLSEVDRGDGKAGIIYVRNKR